MDFLETAKIIQRCHKADVGFHSFVMLGVIVEKGEPTFMRELWSATGATSASMTTTVDHLMERGLVERETGRDRRRVYVEATEKGREMVERILNLK